MVIPTRFILCEADEGGQSLALAPSQQQPKKPVSGLRGNNTTITTCGLDALIAARQVGRKGICECGKRLGGAWTAEEFNALRLVPAQALKSGRESRVLYLVSTPIGNLKDITNRALETLKAVDLIACEDTRITRKLLAHYGFGKQLMSFHEHNEHQAGKRIIGLLREGKDVAVVTDGGTPGISDPGFTIVQSAIGEGLAMTMVPGPVALTMALVLSGLPVHSFTFRGFPPRKRGPRRRFLAVDRESPHTLVLYESRYRLMDTLRDALEVLGDRRAAVANDLTKLFERVYRGRLSKLISSLEHASLQGEYCVVIGSVEDQPSEQAEE